MLTPILITIAFVVLMVLVGTFVAWLDFEPVHRAHVSQGDILAAYRQRHKLPQKD